VIADDLTGANEIAALLTREGVAPRVIIDPVMDGCPRTDLEGSAVVDLESRGLTSSKAYEKVKRFSACEEIGRNLIYKKVDSTLRGNIVSEIEGMVESDLFDLLLLAPGFPEMGRRTVGGYHLVKGKPLMRTEYANHEDGKFHRSNICGFLNSKSNIVKAGLVELSVIEQGPQRVAKEVEKFIEKGINVVVSDAVEDSDLEVVTSAIDDTPYKALLTGSAGLFQALLRAYEPNIVDLEPSRDPALVICGSLNTNARRQLEILKSSGTDLEFFEISLEDLIAFAKGKFNSAEKSIKTGLEKGRNIVVTTPSEPVKLKDSQIEQVDRGLGIMTERLIKQREISGLFLTGGETARKILQALEIDELQVLGELEPLIPVASAQKGFPLKVITKAGGFGSDRVMMKAVQSLRNRDD